MHLLDRLSIRLFHDERQKQFSGDHARSLGWSSTESQFLRFKTMVNALNFDNKRVLDLGCGYGDFKTFLDMSCCVKSYIGVDQQSSFIRQAKANFKQQINCEFIKGDFSSTTLPIVDIVVASGSLNYRARNKTYHAKVIRIMYEKAEEAVIFNLLNSDHFESSSLLEAHNPELVLNYCLSLCPNSELITGYTNEDFTIVMRK
ncbi:class I SAM-dependent methyltransferase [Aliivibrio sifiae]|uniref:Methyltransferase n=1 Tax=Aliivibrio sifiae TaxID=566293 RepID=A0A2S7X3B7_9GAMM|nr:class I SAM-dependent methyltransferase [Aliivibrio sifiae]PQJ84682.1 methyltransferase [Aliivibrio sifiae]